MNIYSLTTQQNVTAIGYYALYNNTNPNNTAVGSDAARNVTTGYCTAIGRQACGSQTTADQCTAVGQTALYTNQTGDNNTAVGVNALYSATAGNNTAVGRYANMLLTTATSNTSIGYNAGYHTTTGNNNTNLGSGAAPTTATASNEVTLGNSQVSSLRCNDTSISGLSDQRDKTEIIDLPIGLDFINALKPRKFKWETRDGNIKDGTYRAGFIAQELQSLESSTSVDYLDLVMNTNPDRLEAKEGHLLPVLVKAIQDLSVKNDALEARIATLEGS